MLTRLHNAEFAHIVGGDVVYHWSPDAEFPLHAGIYVGDGRSVAAKDALEVESLPATPHSLVLGRAIWGFDEQWHTDLVGQRRDVDIVLVKQAALVADAVTTEHRLIGSSCRWNRKAIVDRTRTIRDGIPLFIQGSCSQFVEYVYEGIDLDLVKQEVTYDPASPDRIYPATQIHAFWRDRYPLTTPWDARLSHYPDCLFE